MIIYSVKKIMVQETHQLLWFIRMNKNILKKKIVYLEE